MEAPSGFEPLNRSFADCSLSHLGTAPLRTHYKESIFSCTRENGFLFPLVPKRLESLLARQDRKFSIGSYGA
jgi:hypothetical protein